MVVGIGDRRDEDGSRAAARRVYSPEERRASREGRSTDGRRGVGEGLDGNGRWDVDDETRREGLAIRALAPEAVEGARPSPGGLAARAAEAEAEDVVLILEGVRVDERVGD